MAVSKDELVLEIGFSLSAQPLPCQFQYYRASVVQTSLSVSVGGGLELSHFSISVIKANTLASFPRAFPPHPVKQRILKTSQKKWSQAVASIGFHWWHNKEAASSVSHSK